MLPESVMQHAALAEAPHAALRVLAILICGKSHTRNGSLMITDSYAAKFGMNSRETLTRSLTELEQRGLISRTRRVMRFRKAPVLWAVTWLPIHYRDGQPLQPPEDAPHTYRNWSAIKAKRQTFKRSTPTIGVESDGSSHRLSNEHTPTIGVERGAHHTDLPLKTPIHHTDSRSHSKNLGLGAALADARLADAVVVARSTPGISAADLAKRARCDESIAHRALQRLQAEVAA